MQAEHVNAPPDFPEGLAQATLDSVEPIMSRAKRLLTAGLEEAGIKGDFVVLVKLPKVGKHNMVAMGSSMPRAAMMQLLEDTTDAFKEGLQRSLMALVESIITPDEGKH